MKPNDDRVRPPNVDWHSLGATEVARQLDTGPAGLEPAVAAARLLEHGPNRLEAAKGVGPLGTLIAQFQSPLIAILLLAGLITVLLGEHMDAIVIAAVLAINAAIGFFQERRAEASVRALMQLVSPHARVLRAGREVDIEGADLVPGDLVLLQSGDRVPADLRLLAANELRVDESLLTGESTTVHKHADTVPADAVLADRRNFVFAGSIVSSGRARGYAVGTGHNTELGRIADVVHSAAPVRSPLEERMARFGRRIGLAVGAAAIATFALGIALGNSVADMLMVAVALAVAAIPEGLPVVLTVALAVGVRRMAKRNAILRRLNAVETLGSTSLIGSDKTGTLTENRMTVLELWSASGTRTLTSNFEPGDLVPSSARVPALPCDAEVQCLLAAVLANEAQAQRTAQGLELLGDPTETALLAAAARLGVDVERTRERYPSVREIPFESERRFAASARAFPAGPRLFAKGAPERILGMCSTRLGAERLDPDEVLAQAEAMAGRGLRVLALAAGEDRGSDPEDLAFLGLIGMIDPPRPGVAGSIADCQAAGIRVVMITGDHAATALAIARDLGIVGRESNAVLTGSQVEGMDAAQLEAALATTSVFARVSPEHKLRVVEAGKALGHVVAVTGDGVNDAPALERADIGIAMGRSGTDVAREAADMVLADDNFVSIHAAVKEGRVTFDNVRKVTYFLVSTGCATVVLIPLSLVLGLPLPLLPAQLLWLNLVTNGLQDVALAFEPAERGVLARPPHRRREPIVSGHLWERAALSGITMALCVLWLFMDALESGRGDTYARSMALTGMVLAMAFHVGSSRSEHRPALLLSPFSNRFLILSQLLALGLHAGALHWPITQRVLRVEALSFGDWARAGILCFAVFVVAELHKLLRRPKRPAKGR